MMSADRFLFVVGAVGGLALGHLAAAQPAPETPKKIVSSQYHGVTVEDPYQWLEEDNELLRRPRPGHSLKRAN
jgi:Prolyl oligopeptidase, N-terminal beta-propeller domain.